MKVLAIDTALGACTAAVGDGERLFVRLEMMAKGHQERVPVLVQAAMSEAGLDFAALDRIGVTVGPGSFTGLRIGLSFALGLGAALDVPVVGVPTLLALAESLEHGSGPAMAVIDGRRGQVYRQWFHDAAPLGPPEAVAYDTARAELAQSFDARVVGAGVSVVTPPGVVSTEMAAPSAPALVRLTAALDPGLAPPRPLYLRAPDAAVPTRLPGQARPGR